MASRHVLATVLVAMVGGTAVVADVLRGTGGPMNFDYGLEYGGKANYESSLLREWVIVNDARLPVSLSSFSYSTEYEDSELARFLSRNPSLNYDIDYYVEVQEAIQAIEVRFIPFDIWGERGRALSATDIRDIGPGTLTLNGIWRILSDNEAAEHYAMLGYIAQVKLASGEILHANTVAVVEEARRFSADFTSSDLSTKD
ncbi:MAG: hypothetical protein GDA36_01310 [Rhodobacteraceae bacterium]|nr:hypothetical protein [Paracoccaceae bacterium]